MKPEWILVANASRARLLTRGKANPLLVLQSFEHPQSRSKISDLVRDRAGHESKDDSYGGVAFESRLDAKDKEHRRFARLLAEHLEEAANKRLYRSFVVFASSSFLGHLKAEFGAATLGLLSGSFDLDLTNVGLVELRKRIPDQLVFSKH